MADVPADFETVAEIARRMKWQLVADHGNDANEELSDLRSFVVVIRAGQQIGLVYASPGPDGVREACYWAGALLRPHELFLVADARMRTYEPAEKPPDVRKGQYQEDWEAGRREGITECVIIQRIPVIGNPSMAMYPYVRQGTQLRWERERVRETDSLGGAVLDYARAGFKEAQRHSEMIKILDQTAQLAGLSQEEKSHHIDRACARHISTVMDGLVHLFDGEASFIEGAEVHLDPREATHDL
jgi:hypothetical protein